MKSLHISLNTAQAGCKPSTFMSSFTHSLQVSYSSPYISPLPPPLFYRSILNHPHTYAPDAQTTSICHASPHPPHFFLCHPEDCTNPHCAFYPFNDTPHIHLTIIVLSRLCRFSAFIIQVSVPYVNTQALYIFLFMWYDAPRAVRIGDNSLNPSTSHNNTNSTLVLPMMLRLILGRLAFRTVVEPCG